MSMEARYFARVLSLARHALYAAADLPADHAQKMIIRHQVCRLMAQFNADDDQDRVGKLARLVEWYDTGAVKSNDMVVLSEAQD